tara:strand:+ start:148 stop:555 length:408 start_codon:yes stop_codon:yes gene_type:complete
VNWRRTFGTCALCIVLLVQGIAAVAAAPACTGHGASAPAGIDATMPTVHHAQHGVAKHADMNAPADHAAHAHTDHPSCDCGQDCARGCALHAPGQFVPDGLLALPVPHTNVLPLHADDYPRPTVVTPRLRPPTVS